MQKISNKRADSIVSKYAIKAIVSSVLSVLILSFAFAQLFLRLDIDLNHVKAISVIICSTSAFVVSLISVTGLKNNGLIMGILSSLPLFIYCSINLAVNKTDLVYYIIKITLMIIISGVTGYFVSKKSKKIKV